MISEEEKLAVVKMFCAYCRRTLRNARTDIIRKQAREARWETVFSDMHESELNRLASPDDLISEEVVFEVVGREVVVMDTVLADAIHGLSKCDQAIVLLYYFAEWTDRRIAEELGCPRSTVQFRRSKALLYEVMVAAGSGDPVAMQKVLAYFDGYMDQLCTHAFLDESGRVEYGVDTLRKTQLQGKLLAAMLRFEV